MTAARQTSSTVRWTDLDADLGVRSTASRDTRGDLRSAEPVGSGVLREAAGR